MFKRQREEGFNLSFLDVMACGLGAVILILILVKFSDNTPVPSDEVLRLEQELAALKAQAQSLDDALNDSTNQATQNEELSALIANRISRLQAVKSALDEEIKQQQANVAKLEQEIKAQAPKVAADPIPTPQNKEQTYLLGLKVEGSRIVILIDSSASMTDESLIEVIGRKFGSDSEKKAGPKWQRTQAIARWLLARLPEQAQFSVVSFNQAAKQLGQSPVMQANDVSALGSVIKDLSATVPSNGTNLQAALKKAQQLMPNMTHLYLVTDGLPTLVDKNSGFVESRNCRPELGKQATINGECRMQVFAHTVRKETPPRTQINVVLLPLEGDPTAPAAYWSWVDQSKGTFIAPAANWP